MIPTPDRPSALVKFKNCVVSGGNIASIAVGRFDADDSTVLVSSGMGMSEIRTGLPLDEAVARLEAWQNAQADYQRALEAYYMAQQQPTPTYGSAPTPLANAAL